MSDEKVKHYCINCKHHKTRKGETLFVDCNFQQWAKGATNCSCWEEGEKV